MANHADPQDALHAAAPRALFAACAAALAFAWQYLLYISSGLIWSLFLCAPLVSLLDRLWPAQSYARRDR